MKIIYNINFICRKRNHNKDESLIMTSIPKFYILFILLLFVSLPSTIFAQAASSNYDTETGTLGTTYSWIDCTSGTTIVTGDDSQGSFSWPFTFSFYDNTYTTSNNISVATNGFIRFDGTASTNYTTASAYTLSSTSTELGQIIAAAVTDGNIGDISSSWVRYLVTGSSPNQILTIEFSDLEIDYNDARYTDVQVSLYETTNKVVLKLGSDNITVSGVDMGIHSGVSGYYDKWQEVLSGTNNTWIEYTPTSSPTPPSGPQASWNYETQTGSVGTTYSWIDCTSGTTVVSGDDTQASISWPFDFSYYDNDYSTSDNISVCTNGFIRLDGVASTDYSAASSFSLSSTSTSFGQIIAMGVYDGNISDAGSWVRSLVTGTAPNRIFTIEYNNLEIDYNDNKYTDVQVSFYESTNKIVLKLGADNVTVSGADIGLHSGVNTFYNKWQEVTSGTNNTWIEYTPPFIEVNASIGSSLSYYSTLKSAFDKINDGTHQGVITVKVKHSTIETASAVLNSSGSGNANYNSINIYPTVTGLSINGNLAAPLIDLNGADNITIDGRVNVTGSDKDLILNNTSTASVNGTSTIRLINGAKNNNIKYCTIKGSETLASSGVILFHTTSTGSGNANNVIDNNNITSSASSNRPVNAIYSSGTTGKENSGVVISNNNIYDFLKHSSASNGIYLSSNTTNWTIDGNSFYETASFSSTGAVTYAAININNTSGNNFVITNNYIGGNEELCGGSAWSKTSSANNVFYGIYLTAGTTTASSIQNNTIQNFSWSNSGSAMWAGIYINAGNVNIGTTSGNTIGATTGTASIELINASTFSSATSYGIYIKSPGDVNIYNNSIGSVKTTSNSSSYSYSFMGIYKAGNVLGNLYVEHNLIGSLSTAYSIQAATQSTSATPQNVYGIRSDAIGNTWINENTIANLYNAYNYASATKGQVAGVYTTNGINIIQGNTIRDLSSKSPSNDVNNNNAVVGISQQSTSAGQVITENTIYNLSSTYTGIRAISVMGIYYYGGTSGTNTISKNFIHSFSLASTSLASSSASAIGIKIFAGTNIISNNIVSLGTNITSGYSIYGIYENGNSGNNNSIYFNSVYIGDTITVETASTYALYNATNNNSRDIRNNVFYNARSGGTSGNHYAIRLAGTTNVTIDYNDYFVSGTSGILGKFVNTNKTDLSSWQTITGQDANSLNTNPNFTSPGGISFSDYVTSASISGISIAGISTDYDGITRANPPKIGALESSLTFVWQGNTDTDFGTASNWENGAVPPNGVDISFATTPANDCYLDQNRTIKDITNTSAKKLIINGNQLTLTGSIVSATTNQLDASSASSAIVFAGNALQSIPADVFLSNTIGSITLNNNHGLTQNNNITILSSLILTDGEYTIGANTLTINGDITTTAGSLTGGSSSNIFIGGSGASTSLPGITVNNLTLNRLNGISLSGDLTVNGILTLTLGTLTIADNTLTIAGGSPTRVNGNIDPSNSSATLVLTNPSPITCPESLFSNSINNVTINGGGIIASSSCTINGILNLQSANPSSTQGLLHMGTDTLTMGPDATTIGIGDVTGTVKREHTFITNTEYSFGSQNTTFLFIDSNTKPTWICLDISIGSLPGWSPWSPSPNGQVKRLYKVSASNNSSTSQANINMRYLLSEIDPTYNDESSLVFWHRFTTYAGGLPHEHGKSNQDFTNHFLSIVGLTFGAAVSSDLEDSQVAIAYPISSKNTWKGEVAGHETEWEQNNNWTAGNVPLSTDDILIPSGLTHYPSLTSSSNAVAKSIEIETGASITANSYDITVSGAGGAWINQGAFYPGTGKVLFNHGVINEIVTIAGITNFYDIEVGPNTAMQPVPVCIVRIAGTGSADITSLVDFSAINSTVEWNGADQTIVNPMGIGGNSGYYNLVLSGSGTKTMPTTTMYIAEELKLSGTATATAQAPLIIGVEFEVLPDATFYTGNYDHTVGGPFDNRGTFIASPGTKITLNGTSVQDIYGGSPTTFEKLEINNSAGVTISTPITVNDTLLLTSGNLNVGATNLTINGAITKTSGFINTSTQSSLTFGGTTALIAPSDLFVSTPEIDNLTINRTGGVELSSNFTVNGILNLQSANASSTKGALDMGTYTLSMGENATTIGDGDLTGIVKREHIFTKNVEYTFGNQHTIFNFNDDNLKPTWISLKITIGSVAPWSPWSPSPNGKVKRLYQVASSQNSSTSAATILMPYLVSELDATYNDEEEIVFWHKFTTYNGGLPHEHGKSLEDFTHHYIGVTGLILGAATSSDLNDSQVTFAYPINSKNTWKGEVSGHETEWEQAGNWTAGHVPLYTEDVYIPGGLTNYPSLTASANAVANSMDIAQGASITANSYNITVYGASGAWINGGNFIPGSGTVIFDNTLATISGTTNFYNVTINSGKSLRMEDGCIMRIAGAIENNGDWHVVTTGNSTVEYNGGNQIVIAPNTTTRRYSDLILSGTGTKTMPGTALNIEGDFTISGTATATGADTITIYGNTLIESGATFITGNNKHFFKGNFEDNGTFTATSGGQMIFNGASAQTISGSSSITFDNICTLNSYGVSLETDINVNGELMLCDGPMNIGANTVEINGTINNMSGNLEVNNTSSISFGGTNAITLNNNLFNANPTINNLSINRSGGVTLGNEDITVNGTLALTSGTLALAEETLTIAGVTPTVTSGNIDASNTSATLAFENSTAITLPLAIFNGSINNLTINGSGITSNGNISVNGILNLESTNPSSIKGTLDMGPDTLDMGVSATSIGIGDVTGTIKREHTFTDGVEYSFGNQYTNLNFLGVAGSTKPSWILCKIVIGSAPTWRSEAINRYYSFAQSGGNDRMIVKLHYLDSELHGSETDETQLVFWDAYDPAFGIDNFVEIFPRNHNNVDQDNNWIQLTGPAINYLATSSSLNVKQWGLAYTNVDTHTWIGLGSVSYPGDWSLPGHWHGGVPDESNTVLIPATLPVGSSGYPYRNLLPVLSPATAYSVEIESGASLTSDNFDITITGFGDAWVNNGSFAPGSGTVIFDHSDETEIVNISGTTNFNNLTIKDKTYIKAASNSIIRINGILDAENGSLLDFTENINTIEYKGSSTQNVVNPISETNSGYYNLILSGNGTKTLPAISLNILGNLTANATISATGDTLVMNGTAEQSISGSVALSLNDFTNSNTTSTVTVSVDIDCSGDFINSGEINMTTDDLGITGTVSNTGTLRTASVSSTPLPSGKTWNGTVQYNNTTGSQTVMAGTYNNLTLSNTSGTQSASGNLTVNATLTTASGGLLDMVSNQLLGTLSTITNGGTIQTQNTSSTPIPTGKTWGGTVNYNTTTGGQTIMAGTYSTLTVSNTSGTQTSSGAIAATTLNTSAGGILNMVTYALSGLTSISSLGTLRTQNTSSTPFTSGLSWGGTVIFDGSAGQTLPSAASTFNNLTISNTSGVTAAANQTINGTLNLSVANPDATHGSLDMDTDTLFFGANANTIGVGDVTGIMTRTSFVINTTYTYGNPNQYVIFPEVSGQTLPDTFSIRVTLLSTAPSWVTDATLRLYEIAQTGGANTKGIFRANYLDDELASGVDESVLSFWQNVYPFGGANIVERGWSDYDSQENWISFSDANFGLIPSTLGVFLVTLAPTQVEFRTWNGSQSTTTWNTSTNWTPQGIPSATLGIVIPDVSSSNSYSPDLPTGATGKYLIIQDGGILNTVTDATITLSGNGNVWSMESGGEFNAGNSNVTFDGNISSGSVANSGETDFYDLTIAASTTFRPGTDSYIGIAGTLTNNGIFAAATNHNIIEFKKDGSFTIPNPNGSTEGYHTLVISGTGTKTLPTPLSIWHDFTNNGTVDAGTGTVTMSNLSSTEGFATTIGGSSSTTFYNLIIDNPIAQVHTTANISIASGGTLTINADAVFKPGAAYTVGGAGTLTGYGIVEVTRIATNPDFVTQFPITTKILTNLTVDYEGAGDQTVNGLNYYNLIIESNGTRNVTLEDYATNSAKIGVSGVFEPDLTTTTYTISGSLLEANGTGSQTVPAFNYYNVNVTGDRGGGTITLVNGGTIGIAGHSTVSATNCDYELTNNTIDINGSGDQTIDPFSFYNVIFSGGGTKTTTGDLVVYVGFTVESGVTLDMSASTLSGTMAGGINNSGTIKTSNTSATPIPTNKTWGGTIEYTGSAAQTISVGTYNNLTLSGAGGGALTDDITVNGILNLSHANLSSTQGILHTSTDTLFMGSSATTTGVGDVTGVIKREHTFDNGIEYSFGNQYTTLEFLDVPGNTKPTWISLKVEIGNAPVWRSEAVKRTYSFAQDAIGTDRLFTKLHYLDSELNGAETDESQLTVWNDYDGLASGDNTFVNGETSHNSTENWVGLVGMANDFIAPSTTFAKQYGIGYTNVTKITWTGLGSLSYPSDWSLPGHWSGGVPSSTDSVLIPSTLPVGSSGYPTRNLLPAISPSEVKTLEIEAGATVDASDYDITISGATDAWINNGTFIAGTSAVIFNNGSTSNTAEIEGTTNFYDLIVDENTKIQTITNSITKISGGITAESGSILDFITNANTVEFNGSSSQSVFNPGAGYGYNNLTFSGNGTKILPASTLSISGDLSINSTISASGNTVLMDGSSAQNILSTVDSEFYNLTVSNTTGITLESDMLTTINGSLLINSGKKFEISAGTQLYVSGSLVNNSGVSGFILHSDETGTASLTHKTDNVPATVERYISGAAEDWHFLSSPVDAQAISGEWVPTGTYGNGTGYDLYYWNEPTSCWIYKLNTTTTVNWNTVHPGSNFMVGKGYLYSVEATNPTKSFEGNLNNGEISTALTINGTDALVQGFNMLGNPYPSSIDWKATSGWTRDILETNGGGKDMWIWNPDANNYGVFNSNGTQGTNDVSQYIAPMQGFFVKAAQAGDLYMTNLIRVHNGADNWFKDGNENIRIKVKSEANGYFDEALLQFGYPMNEAGASKLFSHTKEAPSLYLPAHNDNLTVRYLTSTDENENISLEFIAGEDGEYSIDFDFDYSKYDIILLEDKKTNTIHNLKENNTYDFIANSDDKKDRFEIHFTEISEDDTELPVNINVIGNNIIIDLSLVDEITDVRIVDLLGRTMSQVRLSGNSIHRIPINIPSQLVIVNVETKKASKGSKIFIN